MNTRTKCYQATYHKDGINIAIIIQAEDDIAAGYEAIAISKKSSLKLLDVIPNEIFSK
tara:strand:- start:1079 stop:1252 length:174 start_codon:yes stop_codon:yes gene_type:complete